MIVQKDTPHKIKRMDKNQKLWAPDVMAYHLADGYYDGTIGWEQNPQSGVSSHFVVAEDGRITQLVPLDMAAYTQGLKYNWENKSPMPSQARSELVRARAVNPNCYCISIEFAGFWKNCKGKITDEQIAAAVEIEHYCNAELMRMYGAGIPPDREHHIGHCEINPTGRPCCPGELFPYDEIMRRIKGQDKPVTPPKATFTRSEWDALFEAHKGV